MCAFCLFRKSGGVGSLRDIFYLLLLFHISFSLLLTSPHLAKCFGNKRIFHEGKKRRMTHFSRKRSEQKQICKFKISCEVTPRGWVFLQVRKVFSSISPSAVYWFFPRLIDCSLNHSAFLLLSPPPRSSHGQVGSTNSEMWRDSTLLRTLKIRTIFLWQSRFALASVAWYFELLNPVPKCCWKPSVCSFELRALLAHAVSPPAPKVPFGTQGKE